MKSFWVALRRSILGLLWLAGDVPKHVAFVMDGNRRFAEQEHIAKLEGHEHGYSKMVEVIHWCLELGVQYISVYAFSIDNFQRSPEEVGALMHLAEEKYMELGRDGGLAEREGVEMRILGELSALPPALLGATARLMRATAQLQRKRAVLNICFSYTSTDELATAVHDLQEAVRRDELRSSDVTPALLTRVLHTAESPPVDLLVRTSGETRLSDFLAWQVGRAQLEFVQKLWPDLGIYDFARIIARYQRRLSARPPASLSLDPVAVVGRSWDGTAAAVPESVRPITAATHTPPCTASGGCSVCPPVATAAAHGDGPTGPSCGGAHWAASALGGDAGRLFVHALSVGSSAGSACHRGEDGHSCRHTLPLPTLADANTFPSLPTCADAQQQHADFVSKSSAICFRERWNTAHAACCVCDPAFSTSVLAATTTCNTAPHSNSGCPVGCCSQICCSMHSVSTSDPAQCSAGKAACLCAEQSCCHSLQSICPHHASKLKFAASAQPLATPPATPLPTCHRADALTTSHHSRPTVQACTADGRPPSSCVPGPTTLNATPLAAGRTSNPSAAESAPSWVSDGFGSGILMPRPTTVARAWVCVALCLNIIWAACKVLCTRLCGPSRRAAGHVSLALDAAQAGQPLSLLSLPLPPLLRQLPPPQQQQQLCSAITCSTGACVCHDTAGQGGAALAPNLCISTDVHLPSSCTASQVDWPQTFFSRAGMESVEAHGVPAGTSGDGGGTAPAADRTCGKPNGTCVEPAERSVVTGAERCGASLPAAGTLGLHSLSHQSCVARASAAQPSHSHNCLGAARVDGPPQPCRQCPASHSTGPATSPVACGAASLANRTCGSCQLRCPGRSQASGSRGEMRQVEASDGGTPKLSGGGSSSSSSSGMHFNMQQAVATCPQPQPRQNHVAQVSAADGVLACADGAHFCDGPLHEGGGSLGWCPTPASTYSTALCGADGSVGVSRVAAACCGSGRDADSTVGGLSHIVCASALAADVPLRLTSGACHGVEGACTLETGHSNATLFLGTKSAGSDAVKETGGCADCSHAVASLPPTAAGAAAASPLIHACNAPTCDEGVPLADENGRVGSADERIRSFLRQRHQRRWAWIMGHVDS